MASHASTASYRHHDGKAFVYAFDLIELNGSTAHARKAWPRKDGIDEDSPGLLSPTGLKDEEPVRREEEEEEDWGPEGASAPFSC